MRATLPGTRLPAFEPLLNGDLWQRWTEQGRVFPLDDVRAAVRYIRLKPDVSCRLMIFAESGEQPAGFLLHLFPELARARQAWEKVVSRPLRRGLDGHEPFFCEALAAVAVPYPNDAEVPGLRHLYRRHRLRLALHNVLRDYPESTWTIDKNRLGLRLLAYKPGRRAVFRVDVNVAHLSRPETVRFALHAKVENPEHFEHSWTNLARIGGAVSPTASWRVPRARGRSDPHGLNAAEWVDARPLLEAAGGPDATQAFHSTGAALAGLHGLAARLEPAAHLFDPDALGALAEDLAALLPREAESIRLLGARLGAAGRAVGNGAGATIHGDMHLGQVLLEADRPVLIDFDRAGRGHACSDIGSFLAHLEETDLPDETADAFLQGYRGASGQAVDPRDVAVFTAAAWFRRAILPFRRLDADWPDETRRRLERVATLLSAHGR